MIQRSKRMLIQIATLVACAVILLGCPSDPKVQAIVATTTSSSTGGGEGGGDVCVKNTDGCATTSTTTSTSTSSSTTTTTSSTGTTGGGGEGGFGGEGGATVSSSSTTTTASSTSSTGNGGAGGGSTASSASTGVGGSGGMGGDPSTSASSSSASGTGGAGGDPSTSASTSSATTGSSSSSSTGAGGGGGGVLGFGPWTQYNDPDLSANYTGLHSQAVSTTDFYVLGQEMNGDGRIQHFDGVDFVPQTIVDNVKYTRRMRAIGSDLFVFGASPAFNCRIVQRGANNVWSTVPGTPAVAGGGCVDGYGQDTNDMFLIANGPLGLEIYRGPKNGPWTPMALPVTAFPVVPAQIWGSSSSDVYIVGYYYDNGVAGGALLHYNGSTWSALQVDPSIKDLKTVSGSGSNNVAVAGVTNAGKGVIVHFNGQSWSNPALQNDVDVITDMVVRAPNEVLAVGMTNSPFNTAKVGAGNASQGYTWSTPAAQYGNLNGIVTVPGSDLVLVIGDSVNGGQAFSAICN